MAAELGTAAAAAQLIEQLAKSVFLTVREILRAAKDLNDVPKKTKDLIEQVEFVDRLLHEVDPTYSMEVATASPMEIDSTEFADHLRNRVARNETDPEGFLERVLKELNSTLIQVNLKVKKYEVEDTKREGKNKTMEVVKNVFQQGGTKQKKKVEELRIELQKSLEKLHVALNVGRHNNVIEIRDRVVETSNIVFETRNSMESVDRKSTLMLAHITEIKTMLERVNSTTSAPAQVENDMVVQLVEASDVDLDNDSYHFTVESKKASERVWKDLEAEAAGDQEDGRRSSEAAGYVVEDESSLRFTMSVNEHCFFHFLWYNHSTGAEPKLFYPTRSNMKHDIQKEDSQVLFPNTSSFKRGPQRWALKKDGSTDSRKSTDSVFLIFSRNTLVRPEAQARNGYKLEITDVAGALKEHLEKKLGEEGLNSTSRVEYKPMRSNEDTNNRRKLSVISNMLAISAAIFTTLGCTVHTATGDSHPTTQMMELHVRLDHPHEIDDSA